MPQDLFPDPGPDDAEPGGFPPDQDAPGPEQGLFITLPAGQLSLSGFSQGGATDTMAPGALLATVVDAVAGPEGSGLAGCSDDQLLGIISAVWRQQSRDAWTLMAAVGEYARRAGTGVEGEFAADELASELHMSQQGAAGQMDFATEIPKRLPKTFAALGAGLIHPIHLRIIEEETRFLSAADAARADAILAGSAPGQTYGELRYAARKLVLTLDPDIARKRKDAAKREAYVRRFREASGNAGMVARELPSDEVLASWQHVEQRALDLRAAGIPGTLQELRVRAYLALLQERDSRDRPAGGQASVPDQPAPGGRSSGPPDPDPGPGGPGGPGGNGGNGGDGGPGGPGGRAERGGAGHPHHPPGHLAGPLRGPRPGRRVRAPGRRRRPRPGRRRRPPPPHPLVPDRPPPRRHRRCARLPARPASPARPGRPGPARHRAARSPPGLTITPIPAARGPRDHAPAETGYHPSRTLIYL